LINTLFLFSDIHRNKTKQAVTYRVTIMLYHKQG